MSPDTSWRLGLWGGGGGGGGAARLRWDAEAAVKAGNKEDSEVVPEGRVRGSAGGFGGAHGGVRDRAQDAEGGGLGFGLGSPLASARQRPFHTMSRGSNRCGSLRGFLSLACSALDASQTALAPVVLSQHSCKLALAAALLQPPSYRRGACHAAHSSPRCQACVRSRLPSGSRSFLDACAAGRRSACPLAGARREPRHDSSLCGLPTLTAGAQVGEDGGCDRTCTVQVGCRRCAPQLRACAGADA